MGAGEFPAGCGPAGLDPVAPPSPPPIAMTPPMALFFDIATRTFPLSADGTQKAAHPIDQQVMLALGVVAGSIASAVETGNELRTIKRAQGDTLEREAQDIVARAIANLVDANKITVIACNVFTPSPGQVIVEFIYVNNTTKKKQPVKVQIS